MPAPISYWANYHCVRCYPDRGRFEPRLGSPTKGTHNHNADSMLWLRLALARRGSARRLHLVRVLNPDAVADGLGE